ncbi:hypothetical protein N7539_002496 [Penicillium diatomitis]|uniref:F-box domain-containing protein n=1 Tax=Penicillium diatomitis TaxID=2819901 RepID=A0A9W9XES0_9EURO|nr:uncharacterized protein N7539_002496 [Penicillium diatomitis]KAJ5490929.1 hypothetical protein N7539_002496 [Penicillium diatomitis]
MRESSRSRAIKLMDLPTELHMQIASLLPYPDALALKHTNRHFHQFVQTGVALKVDWLIERFENKLECPMEECCFRTDEAFCNWRIRRIMKRRRHHQECRRVAGGCKVVDGQTCHPGLIPPWFRKDACREMSTTAITLLYEALEVYTLATHFDSIWVFLQVLLLHTFFWMLSR